MERNKTSSGKIPSLQKLQHRKHSKDEENRQKVVITSSERRVRLKMLHQSRSLFVRLLHLTLSPLLSMLSCSISKPSLRNEKKENEKEKEKDESVVKLQIG